MAKIVSFIHTPAASYGCPAVPYECQSTYIMSKVHNHRYVRVQTVLEETGFFDFAATLQMKKSDFLAAIDLAPSIKPFRHTYLHEEKYREEAKRLVREDEILNRILVD